MPCVVCVRVRVLWVALGEERASMEGSEQEEPDEPRAIQIVRAQEDHTFDLDLSALKKVLLSEELANRKVVVLSVAGAFRKGKSFLLDYLLRFLNNKVSTTSGYVRTDVCHYFR